MREIKFRAWDAESKIMYDPILILNKKNCTVKKGDIDFSAEVRLNFLLGECNHVLMQYAGLKDKNGKEIYEGDILKIDKAKGNYIVRYYEPLMQFVFEPKIDTPVGENVLAMATNPRKRNVKNGSVMHVEVIGNIHENPELLTPKE